MKQVTLVTREKLDSGESDACLLVIDDQTVNASALGEQVRNLIDRRPLTRSIYIVAPILGGEQLKKMLLEGLAVVRADVSSSSEGPRLWMLDLRQVETALALQVMPFFSHAGDAVTAGEWETISSSLIEGWLFHLFESSNALVHAPTGVHFAKSSGKHSNKFLRASSTLMSTAACGLLAMAALAAARNLTPRRIFVDTGPLLSLAYSMHHVASVRKLWDLMPPAQSFSSYGGCEGLPKLGMGDLVLVSASTSGGLAENLRLKGVHEDMLVTLFYLGKQGYESSRGVLVCDLTSRSGKLYGYPVLDSYAAGFCKLCDAGDVLAELEGDQFLIDRRDVKLLRLTGDTQLEESRKLLENLSRQGVIRARTNDAVLSHTRFALSSAAVLGPEGVLSDGFSRLITRFAPHPIDYVVLVDSSESEVRDYLVGRGLDKIIGPALFISAAQIENIPEQEAGRNFLVIFSVLEDYAQARTINASLRAKCREGNVAYLAALTIASSARAAEDLRIFLSYGSRGADSFTFRSVDSLLLPYIGVDASPWAKERAYLLNLDADHQKVAEVSSRLDWLSKAGTERDGLFLIGNGGATLKIQPDFVFLSTYVKPENVSQADVFAVVGNVLACARAGSGNVKKAPARGTPTWKQTSLYQVLLCPSNFRDFNDAVLRASLLRVADEQELNYVMDETSSAEMLSVMQAELGAWKVGAGNSLPEFLLALSTARLRLTHGHAILLREAIAAANLPEYPKALASGFMSMR
jgi:hypothetical protein